jgi:DNA polymerase III alpha subunit (gram-positive type)
MQAFAVWLEKLTPVGTRPVFVALNAPFDWMFVNDYFHLYLGTNPFGHSALDIKAYYMGLAGVSWSETSFSHITAHLQMHIELEHNALHDAQDQAAIFHELMEISGRKHERNGVGPKE